MKAKLKYSVAAIALTGIAALTVALPAEAASGVSPPRQIRGKSPGYAAFGSGTTKSQALSAAKAKGNQLCSHRGGMKKYIHVATWRQGTNRPLKYRFPDHACW